MKTISSHLKVIRRSTQVTAKYKTDAPCMRKPLHGTLAFEWFSFSGDVQFAFMTKKRISSRLIFIAKFRLNCWANNVFRCVLHLDPVFSTPRDPGPAFYTQPCSRCTCRQLVGRTLCRNQLLPLWWRVLKRDLSEGRDNHMQQSAN